ncbi:MAG: SDR family NAD(P)-dependent oxidoreductase [Bacteriovoracaceae bacterium]|nr:SDR family NAD(P)-dependent oxidoreductase [Bacteriovoracaceae bacterium]
MKENSKHPVIIYCHDSPCSSQFSSDAVKLLKKENIVFLKKSLESTTDTSALLKMFNVEPTPKPSSMSYREKLLHFSQDEQPSTLIFFCTAFSVFSSIEDLSSKKFIEDQFLNVGTVLDVLTGYLPYMRDHGGKIIFVSSNTKKYGSPRMASFESTQRAIASVITSLRENLNEYDFSKGTSLQIVHVETTRPDRQFIELFKDQFDTSERRKSGDEHAYEHEINKLRDLVRTQYSKIKIEATSKKLAKLLVEIVNSKKTKKHYLVD